MLAREMVFHSFKSSLLQAVAITFGDFIIRIAERLLIRWGKVGESWADGGCQGSWLLLGNSVVLLDVADMDR